MIEYFDRRKDTMWGEIGPLSQEERDYLRSLAEQVRRIGEWPDQKEKIALHKSHNSLKRSRPVLLVFLDQSAWDELLPPEKMTVIDPFWRSYEEYLLRTIYRAETLRDDFVIEPALEIPLVWKRSDWGISVQHAHAGTANGAWGFRQSLTDWDMLEQLRDVTFTVDEELTRRNFQAVETVFGDVIAVRQSREIAIRPCILRDLAELRGLEQLMYDLTDEPEQIHKALSFMSGSYLRLIDDLEGRRLITPNNGNHYVGSGGVGYTDDLLPEQGRPVTCANMWGFGEAQELALVSPAMYEEFAIRYLAPILDRFGLNAFACCESLDGKYDLLSRIHNLRRVSISPWSHLDQAAKALEDRCILSWKPDPSKVIKGFDSREVERWIREGLQAAEGCHLELVLKDLITVHGNIGPVQEWLSIVRRQLELV